MAAKSQNFEALKTIFKHGGKNLDVAITDEKGNTVLHHAAANGSIDMFDYLSSKFVSVILLY